MAGLAGAGLAAQVAGVAATPAVAAAVAAAMGERGGITPRTGRVAEAASRYGGGQTSPGPGGEGTERTFSPEPAGGAGLEKMYSARSQLTTMGSMDRGASGTFMSAPSRQASALSDVGEGGLPGFGGPAVTTPKGAAPVTTPPAASPATTSTTYASPARGVAPSQSSAASMSGTGMDTARTGGADTSRTGGGQDTARSYGSARSGGQTARSAFAPSQYSYRSRGSAGGDDIDPSATPRTPRERIGLTGNLASISMPGDSGAEVTPRPIEFSDSSDDETKR
jgi:hypothetical protein